MKSRSLRELFYLVGAMVAVAVVAQAIRTHAGPDSKPVPSPSALMPSGNLGKRMTLEGVQLGMTEEEAEAVAHNHQSLLIDGRVQGVWHRELWLDGRLLAAFRSSFRTLESTLGSPRVSRASETNMLGMDDTGHWAHLKYQTENWYSYPDRVLVIFTVRDTIVNFDLITREYVSELWNWGAPPLCGLHSRT